MNKTQSKWPNRNGYLEEFFDLIDLGFDVGADARDSAHGLGEPLDGVLLDAERRGALDQFLGKAEMVGGLRNLIQL